MNPDIALSVGLICLTVLAFVALVATVLTLPKRKRGQDWTPADQPPEDDRIVEVEFDADWAANYGRKTGAAYFDHSTLQWSLEGVQRWRNAQ
jgi:hypothetical protein